MKLTSHTFILNSSAQLKAPTYLLALQEDDFFKRATTLL
jgi:hypothetical protein